MQQKFIITADDFGVSPLIDDAIQNAAANGLITAAACMANGTYETGKPNVIKAKRLKQTFPNISIGIHFTLTSGKRVSDTAKSLCSRGRRFRGKLFQNVDKCDYNELLDELRAQIKVFEDAGLAIEHFSDHVGILSYYPKGMEALITVVKEYNQKHDTNAVIRNPVLLGVEMEGGAKCIDKSTMYKRARLGLYVKNLFRKTHTLDKTELHKRLKQIHQAGIKTTDYFVEHFYGKPSEHILSCINNYTPKTPCGIRNPVDSNIVLSEMVVHLARKPSSSSSYQKALYELRKYRGISTSYAQGGRAKEFEVLTKYLPWSDLESKLVSFKIV